MAASGRPRTAVAVAVTAAALVAVAAVFAVVDAVLARSAGSQPASFYATEIGFALLWSTVGALAAVLRPDRAVGRLMQVLGLVLVVDAPAGFVLTTGSPGAAAVLILARAVQPFQIALFAHLFLSYPEGRLRSGPHQAFIAVVYAYAAVVSLIATTRTVSAVTTPGWTGALPANGLAGSGPSVPLSAGWLLLASTYLVLLGLAIRRATPRARRTMAHPLLCGLLLLVLFVGMTAAQVLGVTGPVVAALATVIVYLAVLAMPGAFLLGLVRERLHYSWVAELLRTVEAAPIGRLRAALCRALRDPLLEVGFPSADGYVDEDGRPLSLPPPAGRTTSPIGGDPPVAVVVHDTSLVDEPKLLAAVSAAARLALDNARLHATVREQLAEVRASRRRIVEAGVEHRRRLERDLHDGAQQRLLGVGMALEMLRSRLGHPDPAVAELLAEAQRDLRSAVTELRELARGIHPAALTEQGLPGAVRTLVRRMPIPVVVDADLPARPPAPVEAAAYFVISEALTNVVKHSGATRATVRLTLDGEVLRAEITDNGSGGAILDAGSGLRGIADRAAAFEGTLTVGEADPSGVRLVVDLRCR